MVPGRACCYATDGTTMGDNDGLEVLVVVEEEEGEAGLCDGQRKRDAVEASPSWGDSPLWPAKDLQHISSGSASSPCRTRKTSWTNTKPIRPAPYDPPRYFLSACLASYVAPVKHGARENRSVLIQSVISGRRQILQLQGRCFLSDVWLGR